MHVNWITQKARHEENKIVPLCFSLRLDLIFFLHNETCADSRGHPLTGNRLGRDAAAFRRAKSTRGTHGRQIKDKRPVTSYLKSAKTKLNLSPF